MEFTDFEHDERMIARERLPEDRDEKSLRPLTWADYSGQKQVTDNLKIFIEAAMRRGEALDHCLLYGPPGLGKTTLAGIIANEMGVNLRITTGPAIEKAGDLAALLTSLQEREVLFIDEIHRLNRSVEEVLYPAMEDFALDIMIGKGPAARSIRLDLPRFTLIGATTRAGMLSAPLRDRFGMVHRLELYKPEELKVILKRDAEILNIGIDEDGLDCLARRSRGTPRIAIRLLKRLRDYAEVRGGGVIDRDIAEFGLEQKDHVYHRGEVPRRSGRTRNTCCMYRRRCRYDRRCVRAVPDAVRIYCQDSERPCSGTCRMEASRTYLSAGSR